MSSLVRPVTLLLGVVLTLAGIAGFFTGGTLLIFQVDTLHNIVHLASGLAGLWAASAGKERLYLLVLGLVYAAVAAVGFVNGGNILGLFMVDQNDNFLHAAIAVVGIALGASKKS